jgi:hypothetical protein
MDLMNLMNLNNLKNMSTNTYIGIFSILFATVIAPRMKDTIIYLLDNNLITLLIFLYIIYIGKQDLMTGLVCSVSFFIMYQNVSEKKIVNTIIDRTQTLLESQPIIIIDQPAEQKVDEQKVYEQKVYEQKVAEQIVDEQKVYEQKVAEQIVDEQKVYEQKVAEQIVAEQKEVANQVANQFANRLDLNNLTTNSLNKKVTFSQETIMNNDEKDNKLKIFIQSLIKDNKNIDLKEIVTKIINTEPDADPLLIHKILIETLQK